MILSNDWEPTYHMSGANFSDLIGKVVVEYQHEHLFIAFKTSENEIFVLAHQQDCCESVFVEDVVGDLDDLLNVPILMAEESSNSKEDSDNYESYTWTYYKVATIKGYIDIRFYGSSNGYYSEGVSVFKI